MRPAPHSGAPRRGLRATALPPMRHCHAPFVVKLSAMGVVWGTLLNQPLLNTSSWKMLEIDWPTKPKMLPPLSALAQSSVVPLGGTRAVFTVRPPRAIERWRGLSSGWGVSEAAGVNTKRAKYPSVLAEGMVSSAVAGVPPQPLVSIPSRAIRGLRAQLRPPLSTGTRLNCSAPLKLLSPGPMGISAEVNRARCRLGCQLTPPLMKALFP